MRIMNLARIKIENEQAILSPTRSFGTLILMFLFIFAALAMSFFLLFYSGLRFFQDKLYYPLFFLLIIFVVFPAALIRYFLRPVIFDKNLGFYWSGRKNELNFKLISNINSVGVHAWYGAGNDGSSSGENYNLILIMNDGKTETLSYYSELSEVVRDGEVLTSFLCIPFHNI